VAGADERKEHIWVHESAQPLKVRSTRTDAPFNRGPLWLGPTEIIFSAKRERKPFAVYLAAVDASADEKLIFEGDSQSEDIFASDISADGRLILYDFHPRDVPTVGVTDIGYLERQPDGRYIPKPFLSTVFGEKAGKLSPDGRWVAYVSDEPGQPEVYVCRFPQGDRKRRVSIRGGSGPRWSPDGKKLYYRQDSVLVETEVIPGPELEIGASRTLFESRMLNYSSSSYAHYDVAPEGNRFLVREGVESTMRIVQNWFAEFNR
jgi:Tol biopolymer transport system component